MNKQYLTFHNPHGFECCKTQPNKHFYSISVARVNIFDDSILSLEINCHCYARFII